MRPVLIGMAGGTASGKTTLARGLAERLSGALLLITHDRYYRDVADPSAFNYDHPDALDTTRLIADLDQLARGEPALLPVYDFRHHRRLAEVERVDPRPLIMVEGILCLAEARLCGRFDHRIYVEAADDIRLMRRTRRDIATRGRSVESVFTQYEATVRPMHQRFVAPSRQFAEHHVSGEDDVEGSLMALEALVRSWLPRPSPHAPGTIGPDRS